MSRLRYEDIKDDAQVCNIIADYYLGEQKEYLIKMLDGEMCGFGERKDWRERGLIPRTRNITKNIVDGSANLYNDPPALELWRDKRVFQDQTFNDLMETVDWRAFYQNVDAFVRALKTVVIYFERYIPNPTMTVNGMYTFDKQNGDKLLPMLLHKGNSAVILDQSKDNIIELAYLAKGEADCDDDQIPYVVVTPEFIEDWIYDPVKGDIFVGAEPNPYGVVPAVMRHDTSKPVYEEWNEPGVDLKDLQEFYNLHYTDTEFAIAWQKQKSLFTNADIVDNGADDRGYWPIRPPNNAGSPGEGAPFNNPSPKGSPALSHVGKLGAIVRLSGTDDGTATMIDYKGPETDLDKLSTVVEGMVSQIARDWAVSISFEGTGNADSGFKLVVKELPNNQLRKRRAQYAMQSHRKEYEILRKMYPTLPDAQLLVKFPEPRLPIDEKEKQDVWDLKISSGRASIIDYFMNEEGLTEEEAMNKALKIKQQNELFNPKPVVQPNPANNASNNNQDGNPNINTN